MMSHGEKAAVRMFAAGMLSMKRHWMIVDSCVDRFGRERTDYLLAVADRLRHLREASAS